MSTRNFVQLSAIVLGSFALALPASAQNQAVHVEATNDRMEGMQESGGTVTVDDYYDSWDCNPFILGDCPQDEEGGSSSGSSNGNSCHDYDNDGLCSNVDDDDDGDGILDGADNCRTVPEDFDGCGDFDGCPEDDTGLAPGVVDDDLLACINAESQNAGASPQDALCTESLAEVTDLVCSGAQYALDDLTNIAVAVPNVTFVDFDDNFITDPSPLAELGSLTEVLLSRNDIADDATLAGLAASEVMIDASGNQLTDIDQLSAAVATGSGIYLDVRCNSLSHAASGGPGGDPNSDLTEVNAVHNAIGTGAGHKNSTDYTTRADRTDCLGGASAGACTLPQVGSQSADNGYCD